MGVPILKGVEMGKILKGLFEAFLYVAMVIRTVQGKTDEAIMAGVLILIVRGL